MTDPGEDLISEIMRRRVAINEAVSSELIGAVLCPEGSHGDFVNG